MSEIAEFGVSSWLGPEWNQDYTRDTVTILAGSGTERVISSGAVLGKITASEKFVALNLAATDGSENASGILFLGKTAPVGTDVAGVALVRGPAIVTGAGLTYPSGATDPQKTAINSALATRGIIVR